MVSDTPLMISDKPSNVYGKRLSVRYKTSSYITPWLWIWRKTTNKHRQSLSYIT
jgi:hypothetical protein